MAPCLCVCVCVRLWVHVCAERFLGGREICEILETEIRSGITLFEKHTPIHTCVHATHVHEQTTAFTHVHVYAVYIYTYTDFVDLLDTKTGLICVAVCCSVLQCVAVCCSVLQRVAVCCSVLQCVAVCCSILQCVVVCSSVLQCVAVCCRVLQRLHGTP